MEPGYENSNALPLVQESDKKYRQIFIVVFFILLVLLYVILQVKDFL